MSFYFGRCVVTGQKLPILQLFKWDAKLYKRNVDLHGKLLCQDIYTKAKKSFFIKDARGFKQVMYEV